MDAWSLLHIVCLLIGSVLSAVLGKFILKFYSTILFTDRNIFTYLSSASVIALQLIVQSRVSLIRIPRNLKYFCFPDLDRLASKNPSDPPFCCRSLEGGFLAWSCILLLPRHLQHWVQDALHLQGFKPMISLKMREKQAYLALFH